VVVDVENQPQRRQGLEQQSNLCPLLAFLDFDNPLPTHANAVGQLLLAETQRAATVLDD
jgi:hypothetical protein